MKYLSILEELLSSDSIIFMLIGLVIAFVIGIKIKNTKKNLSAAIGSIAVYLLCEGILNVYTNMTVDLILLFAGTAAIGSFVGFLFAAIYSKVRK